MGVSWSPGRPPRVYLPFWVAIPLYLAYAVVWAVVVLAAGLIDGCCWLVRAARARHALRER